MKTLTYLLLLTCAFSACDDEAITTPAVPVTLPEPPVTPTPPETPQVEAYSAAFADPQLPVTTRIRGKNLSIPNYPNNQEKFLILPFNFSSVEADDDIEINEPENPIYEATLEKNGTVLATTYFSAYACLREWRPGEPSCELEAGERGDFDFQFAKLTQLPDTLIIRRVADNAILFRRTAATTPFPEFVLEQDTVDDTKINAQIRSLYDLNQDLSAMKLTIDSSMRNHLSGTTDTSVNIHNDIDTTESLRSISRQFFDPARGKGHSGDLQLLVYISDGIRTQVAQSRIHSVQNPLLANIRSPYTESGRLGNTFYFDAEDCSPDSGKCLSETGNHFSWHSDVDGLLSEQRSFETNALSPGQHIITLTVTNNKGSSAQDTVNIFSYKGAE